MTINYKLTRMILPAVLLLSLFGCTQKPNSPNVVFILADDMGYGDLNCQNPESKIPTPYLDELASQGMRFTDAHSPSSVCTPTRYGILTGRYSWRTRLKKGVLWPWEPPLIESDRLTVGNMFQEAGYHTAAIGKWHLGWVWDFPDSVEVNNRLPGSQVNFNSPIEEGPITRGFNYYFGDDVPNFPPYTFIENDHVVEIPTLIKPDSLFGNRGVMQPGWRLDQVMPAITNKAVEYIKDRAENHTDQAFFLYFTLTAPHTPIAVDEQYLGKSKAGLYGDFVHEVDACVGQVLDALDKTGVAENTLVFFTSDNGSPQRDGTNYAGPVGSVKKYGHDPSRPWRGLKSDIWEGGHRVPFLVRWPGKVKAGSVNSELISHIDFMSTIAAILDIDLPDEAAPDSYDISPAIFGDSKAAGIREALVHHSGGGLFAIRQGPWKLIMGLGPGGFSGPIRQPKQGEPAGQLYNLADDPGEEHNLFNEEPEIVEQLTILLEGIRDSGLEGSGLWDSGTQGLGGSGAVTSGT